MKGETASFYIYLGNEKFALGDYQGAIADYTQAISLKPDYASAYINRGVVKSALGDKQGAIADLQEAARLSQRQGNIEMYNQTQELLKFVIIRQL